MSAPPSFDELLQEGSSVPLEGWDFSFLQGRTVSSVLPWNYWALAAELVERAERVLDVDTGGGEVFSSLSPPAGSVAVEPYPPNLAVAAERLGALDIRVLERVDDLLPVGDGEFDLVLNRHGHLPVEEIHRCLAGGGRLLSQQVGAANDLEFNQALRASATVAEPSHQKADLDAALAAAGFASHQVREAHVVTRFLDIAAVVFQLRAVPWQVPGFDVERDRDGLWRIHQEIMRTGGFEVASQRLLIEAVTSG